MARWQITVESIAENIKDLRNLCFKDGVYSVPECRITGLVRVDDEKEEK